MKQSATQLVADLARVSSEKDSAVVEASALASDLANLKGVLAEAETKIEHELRARHEFENVISQKNAALIEKEEEKHKLSSSLEAKVIELENATVQLKVLEQNAKNTELSASDLTGELNKKGEQLLHLQSDHAKLKSDKEELVAKLDILRIELEGMKAEKETIATTAVAQAAELNERIAAVTNEKEQISFDSKAEVSKLKSEIESLLSGLLAKNAELDTLTATNASNIVIRGELEARLKQLAEEKEKLHASFSESSAEKESSLIQLQVELQTLKSSLHMSSDGLKVELQSRDNKIAELSAALTAQSENESSLRGNLKEKEVAIADLESKLATADKSVEELKAANQKFIANSLTDDALKVEIEGKAKEADALKAQVAHLTSEMSRIQADHDSSLKVYAEKEEDIKAEVQNILEEIADRDEIIEKLTKEKDEVTAKFNAVNVEAERMKVELSEKSEEVQRTTLAVEEERNDKRKSQRGMEEQFSKMQKVPMISYVHFPSFPLSISKFCINQVLSQEIKSSKKVISEKEAEIAQLKEALQGSSSFAYCSLSVSFPSVDCFSSSYSSSSSSLTVL